MNKKLRSKRITINDGNTNFLRFMLNLKLASTEDSNSAWLKAPLDFRSIGALAMDHAF